MKTVMKNQAVASLVGSVGLHHQEMNIRVFEFVDQEHELVEKTSEYRDFDESYDKPSLLIPYNLIEPWIKLLEKSRILRLPLEGLNQAMKDNERNLLSSLGSQYLFICSIVVKEKIVGLVCMDDNASSSDSSEIPISIAAFLSYKLGKEQYVDKKKYFLDYLESVDISTSAFNRKCYMELIVDENPHIYHNVGVIHLDFNEIKRLNERFGFEYVDTLLQKLSKQLILLFFPYDSLVFRISGDEFLVVCFNIEQQVFALKYQQLKEKISEDKTLNVAMGSVWKKDTKDLLNPVIEAEHTMQLNKEKYYQKKNKRILKSKILKVLKEEIRQGKFSIYLQPQIDINSYELVGAEALIRKHDKGLLYYPDTFIPFYEAEGVIQFIDLYVLEEVIKFIKIESKQGIPLFSISINFSRLTLIEKNIVSKMLEICMKHQVQPNKVCIEITESLNMMGMNELVSISEKIKKAGFKLSLDDYGSDYSNITILANIDFDEVKLDKNIIQILHKNTKAKSIVSATISMCKNFKNTQVVAEGVETKETLDILRELNCDYVQGYYFSKALSVEDFKQKYMLKKTIQNDTFPPT